jgi:ketosteroid isomerase-like protein
MTKAKLAAATMAATADEVEAAFYDALHNGDLQAMMACWADDDEIVCIHPGGDRLVGHAQIREAFEALFKNGTVAAYPESIHQSVTIASAIHSLVERVRVTTAQGPQDALVYVTNVYHRTPQGWKMVVHHASPGLLAQVEMSMASSPSQVLH